MSTKKLFQLDVYTKEWDAVITSIEEDGKLLLDQTAFFPEGGGQSCDNGVIEITAKKSTYSYNVIDVQEYNDGQDVIHTVVPADKIAEGHPLKAGDEVHCRLDWDRRFDNMQRHCGEHILSGIFYQETGGVNRGFHMGDDYMTVDISLEDEPTNPDAKRPDEITMEIAQHCELLTNQVIWSDAPVTVLRFETREEAEKMPLRKKLAFDEDISIVCVGSIENAADCVACCGTHPSTAGQVGLLKIFKVEKNKGMYRVYFESGQRALKDYDMKHNILSDLSKSYSSTIETVPDKLRAQEEKMAAVKNELFHIKKAFIENECQKLNEILADPSCGIDGSPVVVYKLPNLSMDDAFNMAKYYMGKPDCCGKLILLYSEPDTSYILVSDGSIHCGKLVKEYASFYQGKGGGNDISARGIFTKDEDAEMFADLLSKHLK